MSNAKFCFVLSAIFFAPSMSDVLRSIFAIGFTVAALVNWWDEAKRGVS